MVGRVGGWERKRGRREGRRERARATGRDEDRLGAQNEGRQGRKGREECGGLVEGGR